MLFCVFFSRRCCSKTVKKKNINDLNVQPSSRSSATVLPRLHLLPKAPSVIIRHHLSSSFIFIRPTFITFIQQKKTHAKTLNQGYKKAVIAIQPVQKDECVVFVVVSTKHRHKLHVVNLNMNINERGKVIT